jgi:hypothetical protein
MEEAAYGRVEGAFAAPAWQRLASDDAEWLHITPESPLERSIAHLSTSPPRVRRFENGRQHRGINGANQIAQRFRCRNRLLAAAPGQDLGLIATPLTLLNEAVIEQTPGDLPVAYNDG